MKKFHHLIILTLYFEFFKIYRSKQNLKLEICSKIMVSYEKMTWMSKFELVIAKMTLVFYGKLRER